MKQIWTRIALAWHELTRRGQVIERYKGRLAFLRAEVGELEAAIKRLEAGPCPQ